MDILGPLFKPSFTLNKCIFLKDVILEVVSLAHIFLLEQEFKITFKINMWLFKINLVVYFK